MKSLSKMFWRSLVILLLLMVVIMSTPKSWMMSFDSRTEVDPYIIEGTPLKHIGVSYPSRVYTWLDAVWKVEVIPIVDSGLQEDNPVCSNSQPWFYEPRYQARGYTWNLKDFIDMTDEQCKLPIGKYIMRTDWTFTPYPIPRWMTFARKRITIDSNVFQVWGIQDTQE